MITLVINGRELELEHPTTLVEYLDGKGLLGRAIAVAVNGTVLRRDEYEGVKLSEGDRVEIVRPVGGG